MNGPEIDRGAFASAVANRDPNCDPVQARTVAGELSCVLDGAEGESVPVRGLLEGPYEEIRGPVVANSTDTHYAYVIRSNDRESVVLDGHTMTEQFDGIFRLQFVSEDEVGFLALRADTLHTVRYGL